MSRLDYLQGYCDGVTKALEIVQGIDDSINGLSFAEIDLRVLLEAVQEESNKFTIVQFMESGQ